MTDASDTHPTRAVIHLDRLTHNLRLLSEAAGGTPLWPAVKANAYGHGIDIVVPHLLGLGIDTFCVAHATEARAVRALAPAARIVILSAALPAQAQAIVDVGAEPAVCTAETVEALAAAAGAAGRPVGIHLKVDTGMGRVGIAPEAVPAFLEVCRSFPSIRLSGVMSHFPRADETDKAYSEAQTRRFEAAAAAARAAGAEVRHLSNSAGILDLPDARFDAARPGIALYGLKPSDEIVNPRVHDLQPVLDWTSRITFLKEVPAGTGLSYGHDFRTARPSLIATIPVGYGDGLSRRLSSNLDVVVGGRRCPLVGRVTMDQSMIDVTDLAGRVGLGDPVTLIGRQGAATVTADDMAARLGTINYEITTAIAARVPRIAA